MSGKSEKKCQERVKKVSGKSENSKLLLGNKYQCFLKKIIQKYWIISKILSKSHKKTVQYIFENAQIDIFNTILQLLIHKNVVFIIFQFKYVC